MTDFLISSAYFFMYMFTLDDEIFHNPMYWTALVAESIFSSCQGSEVSCSDGHRVSK